MSVAGALAGAATVSVGSAGAATPTITTTASTSTRVGLQIFANANLLGADNPTGTITFNLYGPGDPTCAAPIFTSTVAVAGTSINSDPFTTSQAGTYRWTASYSGDANNTPAGPTACSDPSADVLVDRAVTVLTTVASPPAAAIHDTATLAGGFDPTGTIFFELAGPGDVFCAAPPVFTSTVPVSGNGSYDSGSFTPTVSGTYKWRATYSGDANNLGAGPTACLDPNESVTVIVGPPAVTLVTQASPGVVLGGLIHDTATLAGGTDPTGTITFNLYGPDDATCTGAPAFTSTVPVVGPGTVLSPNFIPNAVGTYRWVASYSGDANNNPVSTACADPLEAVVVTAPPVLTIVTTASPGVVVGGTVHDTATLAGGTAPTGTITFTLYGPGDATCSAAPAFTSPAVPVAGAGTYDSADFTPTLPGTYRWVAAYSGDANNAPVSTACADPAERVVVTAASVVTIVTTASPGVVVGGLIHDTATVSGGTNPTGTLTFNLYGPDDATCSAAPAFSSAPVPVAGAGIYDSADFTPTAPGTYRWVALYSGDANNAPVTTACNAPNETVVVTVVPVVTVVTVASPGVVVGGLIHDTATLSGGTNPTGTLTFTLYGPGDATCSAAPVFTSPAVPVAGAGTYDSADFTPTAPGTYRWVAAYSGDANNLLVDTICNAPNETVVVTVVPVVTVVTVASPGVVVGGLIHDTATLSGGTNPTGTLTFTLYGPGDATCSAAPVFTSPAVPVAGAGTYDSADFTPTAPGTYRWVAAYSGDANNLPVDTICNAPNETVVVTVVPVVTVVTVASPGVVVGGLIHDTATLSGGTNPTGTLTFTLYGPGDATCSAAPVFTSPAVPVAGAGTYDSADFTPTAPGTYRWVAAYSGDADNLPVDTVCNAPNETVVVTAPPTITLVTTASPLVVLGFGTTIHDTATLSGGTAPTGTITFALFGPNDTTCAGPPIFTSTVPVLGNGSYDSAAFLPTASGFYRWVASYSGDADNPPVGPTACDDPAESVQVLHHDPLLTTTASQGVTVGGQIHDTAVLVVTPAASGTITFDLFGPDDATCAGPPAFVATVAVAGSGSYDSADFTPTAPGTYRWVASYSGDVFNPPLSTACNDPAETVVVTAAPSVTLVTAASPGVVVGGHVHDTATLSGGTAPTGTITFMLHGPDDATCSAAPAFTSPAVPVAGAGSYDSAEFTPMAPGTYRWVAAYSGDADNLPVDTICNAPNETVVVMLPPPPTISVDGAAAVASLPEPGGTFTGSVSVTNSGTTTLTLTGLADDDLNGVGTCAVPQTLVAGAGYACTFPILFTGDAGDTRTIPVTATVTDGFGRPLMVTDTFVITITDVAPSLTVAKTANPSAMAAPGGTVTFGVAATNTSVETVTVVSILDDVYGDLAGVGTCAAGSTVAAGATYDCSFSGELTGVAGDSQTDTVTVTVADDEAGTAAAQASATVVLTSSPPPPTIPPSIPPTVAPTIPPTQPALRAVAPAVGAPLARTGSDVAGHLRLAIAALLAGVILLAGARKRATRVRAGAPCRNLPGADRNGGPMP